MTATERTFKKNNSEFVSMDNQEIYGKTIHTLTFKDAIQQSKPIISDYKVITFEVTNKDIEECVNSNKFIQIQKNFENLTAREFAVALV